MGFLEDQIKREEDLKAYLAQTESMEQTSEKHELSGPSALMQGTMDVSIEFGERFREDSASLGKKKTWKPSDAQKKKNAEIDRGQGLTKRATAYTAELHDTLNAREVEKKKKENGYEGKNPPEMVEEKLAYLFSVKFEKRMLTSANIRANIGDYLTMIENYRFLKDLEAKGRLADRKYRLTERLAALRGPMEVLSERVESFLGQNRLAMDGSVLDDDEEPAVFVYSKEKERAFISTSPRDIDTTRLFDPQTIDAQTTEIDKTALRAVLVTQDSEARLLDTKMDTLTEMTKWDSAERIRNIEQMRAFINQCTIEFNTARKSYDSFGASDAGRSVFGEKMSRLQRTILETKACLRLAEAEADYILETDEEARAEILKKVRDAESDYKKVLLRTFKETLPGAVSVKHASGPATVTREEALSSYSDIENFAFKHSLADAAANLVVDKDKAKYTAFRLTLQQYAECTHYSVGHEEETRRLMEVLRARKEFPANDLALAEVDRLLTGLTKTSDSIPDWNDIPDSLKVDAIDVKKIPKGASLSDLTEEQLAKLDTIPEETEAGKEKGSHRNAALTSVRTWKTLDKDTPLFSHEPTINDLRQGKVSNCYMLASTTGLINLDPQIIKDCIRDNGDGTVTVRLYKPSERSVAPPVPHFVRIPKRVPKLITGGDILSSGAIWMQLIERAAAQVGMFRKDRKGYQSLWYGTGDEWLAMLTGTTQQPVYSNGKVVNSDILDATATGQTPEDTLFDELTHATERQKIFHAGTKDDAGPGMNSGHAYTVLGTKTVGKDRFVVLRNPYANMSRVETVDGVTKSSSFTSSVADATCGQFAMPYAEFLETMKLITLTDFATAFRKEHGMVDNGDGVMVDKELSLKEIADLESSGEGRLEDMMFDEESLGDLLEDDDTETVVDGITEEKTDEVTDEISEEFAESSVEVKKEEKGVDAK